MPPQKERDPMEQRLYATSRLRNAIKTLRTLPREVAVDTLRAAIRSYDPTLDLEVPPDTGGINRDSY